MQRFQTILFAADFSENSTAAFRVACSLCSGKAAWLIVLHVIEPDWARREPNDLQPGVATPPRTEGLGEFLCFPPT